MTHSEQDPISQSKLPGKGQNERRPTMEPTQGDSRLSPKGKEVVCVDASFEPLIPKFLANRKKEVVLMQESLAGQDFETVRSIAHGAKGAGGSYGFDRVTEIAALIEQAAKAADASVISRELVTLASYLDRVDVLYE